MAKRSPILGYNHNVRYRGLVFHVQTEDSGLLNPHLFTHLFHEGVIVSTRKLVYDAGSNEDAIKALMQAQHKAVMKDLRRGAFDDKIEQYLGHLGGLEPRPSADARGQRGRTEADGKGADTSGGTPVEILHENLSDPIELPVKHKSAPDPARADTGDRTIPVSTNGLDAPTDRETLTTTQPMARTKTAQKGSQQQADIGRAPTQLATKSPLDASRESAPVIELEVDDDDSHRTRMPRDTAVELPDEEIAAAHRRPASHGAATLPAMKPPSRPIAPPVVTRPATVERKRPESDVVEVYSPAPPSVEPPPGERSERPGQYSMNRKEGKAIREQTGRLEKIQPVNAPAPQPPRQRTVGGSGPNPVIPAPPRGAHPPPVPPTRPATPVAGNRVPTGQVSSQPHRPHATAPITNRTSPASPQAGSGVVMTRPAVIVGAPPKQTQTQRVRKAREDEGRGFGQGLISEKSLDEVILAYLSEDAEDK